MAHIARNARTSEEEYSEGVRAVAVLHGVPSRGRIIIVNFELAGSSVPPVAQI